MAETQTTKQITAAEAAKAVKRPVLKTVVDKEGKPTGETRTELVAVKADEVLDFKDHGTHIVVVTKDGQKFSSADAA